MHIKNNSWPQKVGPSMIWFLTSRFSPENLFMVGKSGIFAAKAIKKNLVFLFHFVYVWKTDVKSAMEIKRTHQAWSPLSLFRIFRLCRLMLLKRIWISQALPFSWQPNDSWLNSTFLNEYLTKLLFEKFKESTLYWWGTENCSPSSTKMVEIKSEEMAVVIATLIFQKEKMVKIWKIALKLWL